MSFIDAASSAVCLIGEAAVPYLLIQGASRYIGTIIADVTVRETHVDRDTITVHPVESGTPV